MRVKGTACPSHEWAPPDAHIDACPEPARCVAFPHTRASQHVSRTCGKDACPPRPASRRSHVDRPTWSRRRAGTRHLSTRQACAASDREGKDQEPRGFARKMWMPAATGRRSLPLPAGWYHRGTFGPHSCVPGSTPSPRLTATTCAPMAPTDQLEFLTGSYHHRVPHGLTGLTGSVAAVERCTARW